MINSSSKVNTLKYDLLMILITAIWGTSFVVVKELVRNLSALTYLSARFSIATLVLFIYLLKSWKKIDYEAIKGGLLLGLLVSGAFITQSIGLIYTTPSKSAFVTGISVILVPFLGYFIAKTFITKEHILAVMLAACGFGLLTLPEKTESINFGDLITAIGTIFWALHIVYTGLWAKRKDTSSLLLIQLASGTFIFSLSLFLLKCLNLLPTLTEDPSNLFSISWINFAGLVYLSVFATLITIFVQISAQRHISATRAAIIFSLEPGFAAIFSYLVLGERLSFRSAIGGLLIIAAIMLSEIKLFKIVERVD